MTFGAVIRSLFGKCVRGLAVRMCRIDSSGGARACKRALARSSRLEAFLVYDPHHPLSPGALGLAVDRPLVPESVGARGKLPDRAHERDPGSRGYGERAGAHDGD